MDSGGVSFRNKEQMLAACNLLQRLLRSYQTQKDPETEAFKVFKSLCLLKRILEGGEIFTYESLINSYGHTNPSIISTSQEDNARYCIKKFKKEELLKEIEGSKNKEYILQKEIPMKNLIGKPGSLDISLLKKLVDAVYYTSQGWPKLTGKGRDAERAVRCFEKAYSKVLEIFQQEKALYVRYSLEGVGVLGTGTVATAHGLITLLDPYWWNSNFKIEKNMAMNLFEGLKEFFDEEEGAFSSGEDSRAKAPIVDTNALVLISLIKFRNYLVGVCVNDENYEKILNECNHIIKKTSLWILGHQITEGNNCGAWSQQDGTFFVERPKSQATYYAALALSILPPDASESFKANEALERTLKFLKDNKSKNGWGVDFTGDPDPVATARFLSLLATIPWRIEPDEKALTFVETYLKEEDLYSVADIHKERIHLPDLGDRKVNGRFENIRSAGIEEWKTPKNSQILIGLFSYYLRYYEAKIPESIADPISDALNLIISSEENGYWTVEEYGASYVTSAFLYLNSISLYMRAYLDYSHAADLLGIEKNG